MKNKWKIASTIIIGVMVFSILVGACSPEYTKISAPENNSSDLLSFYKESTIISTPIVTLSPYEKALENLRYILEPSFNINSTLHLGANNIEFIKQTLLNDQDSESVLTYDDWNKTISILLTDRGSFIFDKSTSEINESDFIKRKDAIYSLMINLLSNPSIELVEDFESLRKSYILADLDNLSEDCELLIRNAFCLGFTDVSVENTNLFRPEEYLKQKDAVSIIYRVLSNLGFPISSLEKEGITSEKDDSFGNDSGDIYSIETIRKEYDSYVSALENLGNPTAQRKLSMLNKAKLILYPYGQFHSTDTPLSKDNWALILKEVFGLESSELDEYMPDNEKVVCFDTASVAIFKCEKLLGGAEPIVASVEDLEAAKRLIPQFDTAKDVNIFSYAITSGLLDGIYLIPGFTPQRPISQLEALILVKRIIQKKVV